MLPVYAAARLRAASASLRSRVRRALRAARADAICAARCAYMSATCRDA